MVARLPWFRGAAQLRSGDSSSARLVALAMIGAALGARSAPGADYCFDQRVSRGICKRPMRVCGDEQAPHQARRRALHSLRRGTAPHTAIVAAFV